MTVVMRSDATKAEIAAVRAQLDHDPHVRTFTSQRPAGLYVITGRMFGDSTPMTVQTPGQPTPTIEVHFRSPIDASAATRSYETLPGVAHVTTAATP
jgi:hypothetical protein